MFWIRAHPIACFFALAGLLLITITAIFGGPRLYPSPPGRSPAAADSDASVFPSAEPPLAPHTEIPTAPPAPLTLPTRYDSKSPTLPQYATDSAPSTPESSESAFEAFIASLSGEQKSDTSGTPSPSNDALIDELYALIPSTVPIFGGASVVPKRTSEQQALYLYGNAAGSAFLAFSDAHTDMAEDLKHWFENRKGDSADAPVVQIADDMAASGARLAALPDVPASARSLNQRLASSLKDAAEKLKAVTSASGDTAIAEAMKTYNASAEEFTRSYIALSDFFTLHEVTFRASDAGSAFSMPR